MMKLINDHPYLMLSFFLAVLCVLSGAIMTIVGALISEQYLMENGVHVLVWPAVLFMVGVGLDKLMEYM